MKRRHIVGFLLVLFGIIFFILLTVPQKIAPEQAIIANPSEGLAPKPEVAPLAKDDMIVLVSPRRGESIASPLIVRGEARGNWFFEASFPLMLVDQNGSVIAEGYASAEGEWMTTEYVPFEGKLSFKTPQNLSGTTGYLILKKDNPSGEPQFDNSLEVEVTF